MTNHDILTKGQQDRKKVKVKDYKIYYIDIVIAVRDLDGECRATQRLAGYWAGQSGRDQRV